jgi:hypothetical protein
VRSSKEHFVKTSGLRWVSLHLLAPCRGSVVSGPCPSSPSWRPPNASMRRAVNATRRCMTGADS